MHCHNNTFVSMYTQEQLKVVGLVSSLQVEEEIASRERQLNTLLEDKKTLMVPDNNYYAIALANSWLKVPPPCLICRPSSRELQNRPRLRLMSFESCTIRCWQTTRHWTVTSRESSLTASRLSTSSTNCSNADPGKQRHYVVSNRVEE